MATIQYTPHIPGHSTYGRPHGDDTSSEFVKVNRIFSETRSISRIVCHVSKTRRIMLSGCRMPIVLAMLASLALAGCADLPDPDYAGKAHKEDETQLSRPEILADVLNRVAQNAEKSKDYDTASVFYNRSHALDKEKVEPLLGMGRSLAAMDAPLEASEAFGAALALDENNKQAETGLAKSLDLLAMKSGRNPPANIPPAPTVAMADPDKHMMREADPAMSKESPVTGEPAMVQDGRGNGEIEVTDADFGGNTDSPDVKVVENNTGANEKASRVKLDDVLAAIEWKGNQNAGPSADMSAENARVVASAQPDAGSAKPMMSDAGRAAATPTGLTGSSYRLQLAAFSSQKSAQSARVSVFDKADAVLEDVALVIEQSVGGGGKTVYKLRTGPVGDRQRASQLCAKLKSHSVDCFLVVPKGAKSAAMPRKAKRPMMAKSMPAKAPAMKRPMKRPAKPAMTMKKSASAKPMSDKTAAGKPKSKDGPVIRWEVVNSAEEGQPDKGDGNEAQTAAKDDDASENADNDPAAKDSDSSDHDDDDPDQNPDQPN